MRSTDLTLFHRTPEVEVTDNRGLSVRTLQYYRHPDTPETTDECLTRHTFSVTGQPQTSADPRLGNTGLVNITYLNDLAGQPLLVTGADSGTQFTLNDIAGRPHLQVNGNGVIHTFSYEDASRPGRPLSVTEKDPSGVSCTTERFVYAGGTEAEQMLNLAGQCVSHYDTAGLLQTDSISLTGVPLSVTRRLLKEADNSDIVADWQGADAFAWNDLLAPETFTTLTTTDATAAILSTTDAKGHMQRMAYDVAGLLSGSWLTVKNSTERVIVKSLAYAASGQKLLEEHGNGVVTTYTYELQTQRLVGIKTERPAEHTCGAKVLQDLRYDYDPVGNVLKVTNDAEETRFWRNQKVVPENTYVYDSLYQLVSAMGREMARAGQQGSNFAPLSTDSSAYTNYTRTYTYDESGNLTQIRHSSPATDNNYTTNITISDRSNRGVLSTMTENSSDVDALFTVGGQQKQLLPGQNLVWTPRNELLKVTPVVRDSGMDDREHYRYDAGSQRILKVSVQNTNTSAQTQQALYLPGLELRTMTRGNTEVESLQVITVGEAGRAQVRGLHWESGRPDSIDNNSLRWSYDNLTHCNGLELDQRGNIISMEEYYPYGGTAVLTGHSQVEVDYKTIRYSGKERDATGLYYYGARYYQPWVGRWVSADPGGIIDGLNVYQMVHNNPVNSIDEDGQITTILGRIATGINTAVHADFPRPSLSFPRFSLPSFSLSGLSLPDMHPLGAVKKIGTFATKKLVKGVAKKVITVGVVDANSDEKKIKIARWVKALGIGLGLAATVGAIIASAGAALPVAIGGAIAAGVAGGGIGYFSGKLSAGFSRLLHKAPGDTAPRAAVSAQFGNMVSGGTFASATNTALISGVTDAHLKRLGRSSSIRISTAGEIGVAAGTDVQLNLGKPGKVSGNLLPRVHMKVQPLVENSISIYLSLVGP